MFSHQRLFFILLTLFCLPTMAHTIDVKIINEESILTDIVVYLEPIDEIFLAKTDKTIEIGQLNKSFTPYVSVVQLGDTVNFANQDDITHHIYSPIGANKFEFKIYAGKNQSKNDFTEVGEVAMGCNIHDWMSGYLLILNTPIFDQTNEQGMAVLNAEQTGNYRLTVWHPQLSVADHKMSKPILVDKNMTIEFDLTGLIKHIPEQKSAENFDFLSEY